MNLHLVILAGYSLTLMALGLWIGRHLRGASDFFVASRRLGPGLIFSTMLAANIGAGSTVGATSVAFRTGLASWWWVGSAAVGCFVLATLVGPSMRRVAAAQNLRTVGDYLEYRYDERVRGIVSALLWVGSIFILASQLIGLGWILEVVAGIPKPIGCAIGGLVITVYFAAGGLLTSAWVNVVQLTVKLTGFAIAVPIAVAWFGGWSAVTAVRADDPAYWTFAGADAVKYLTLLAPAFVVSPGLLQKVFGARDDRAVRIGVGLNVLGLLLFAGVPTLLGIMARARFPGVIDTPNLALPMVLMYGLPPLAGAVALAAVFSAEVSAADAVLFMLATSLSQDLYKRFLNPAADDARVLLVARLATLVSGVFGVGLALLSEDLVQTLTIFYALLGVSLFVPIVAGLYVRRSNADAAIAAIVGGVGGMLVVQGATAGAGFGLLGPAPAGLLCAAAGWTISLLFTPRVASATR
ncbi:MAG TPA: sodium:solute symporter family protein [Vicinamibacterales bacterium]|nr:sodium:solute symporter family protein [Vicinamibacterales bacterium]